MRISVCALVCVIAGCGGAPAKSPDSAAAASPAKEPAEQKDSAAAVEEKADAEPEQLDLPTDCADGSSDPCVMPRKYVKRLCDGAYPELALYLFAKDSPWTRAYVAVRKAEPFNGHGGPSSDKDLIFDEELLVLATRKANLGGMSVSGVGDSYDLMRWDGTCATLSAGEVRFKRPPKPKHAEIAWRRLDEGTQNALLEDEGMLKLVKTRRKECKGVTMGAVSDKCEKADTALRGRVVKAIRDGVQVPKPKTLP